MAKKLPSDGKQGTSKPEGNQDKDKGSPDKKNYNHTFNKSLDSKGKANKKDK